MSGFNGTWGIDIDRSKVWDVATQSYLRDEVGNEVITMVNDGGVQDYEVLYGDDPVIRMGYRSTFDDAEWVPYLVREVIPKSDSEDVSSSLEAFKSRVKANHEGNTRHFEVGQPYGLVRTVYVDERTHYRIGKESRTNEATYVMMRRLAEDAQSYVATVLDRDGVVYRVRTFVRA